MQRVKASGIDVGRHIVRGVINGVSGLNIIIGALLPLSYLQACDRSWKWLCHHQRCQIKTKKHWCRDRDPGMRQQEPEEWFDFAPSALAVLHISRWLPLQCKFVVLRVVHTIVIAPCESELSNACRRRAVLWLVRCD